MRLKEQVSALEWARLQAAEWDRLRDTTRDAGAWNYYEQAARHLRTLIATASTQETREGE